MQPRTALLLPGQGSQFVGMGRDLAEASPRVDELYREAEEILGVPLRDICWEGPPETLTRTENAQPAILTHSYAVWRLLPEAVRASAVVAAGHSLGEFSAYLLAGTFSFPDALRLVRTRGELMAKSRGEGTMAAVLGMDPDEVEDLCRRVEIGVVVPANLNAPGQVVISGETAAVEAAGELALDAGARRVVSLDVSGAFHSPLMEVAREGLREALEEVTMHPPDFPVVANASAEAVTGPETAREMLIRQLTSPVRWAGCVERMRAEKPTRWIEVGPGRVLSGLLRRIDRSLEVASPRSVAEIREIGGSRPADERQSERETA